MYRTNGQTDGQARHMMQPIGRLHDNVLKTFQTEKRKGFKCGFKC